MGMHTLKPPVTDTADGVRVALHCIPNAKETSILVEHDGGITMRVHAPPTKGKANREIVKWLSKKLRTSSSQIRIISGLHSNLKTVEILRMNRESFLAAIQQ
jgi:uncharacterized protein (TIGR00251 family)